MNEAQSHVVECTDDRQSLLSDTGDDGVVARVSGDPDLEEPDEDALDCIVKSISRGEENWNYVSERSEFRTLRRTQIYSKTTTFIGTKSARTKTRFCGYSGQIHIIAWQRARGPLNSRLALPQNAYDRKFTEARGAA